MKALKCCFGCVISVITERNKALMTDGSDLGSVRLNVVCLLA